jgi:hypothetical protein
MLTKTRLDACIAQSQAKIDALKDEQALAKFDAEMAISFDEHFRFQQMQAEAHASGILETDAALLIYAALGEVGSAKNGGWAAGTSLAKKVIITQVMAELLARKLGR